MKILILGLNYAPENVGIAVYTSDFAGFLVSEGHEVRTVSGKPYYPAWRIKDGYSPWGWSTTEEDGVRVSRVPHYCPAHPSGAKRLMHHFSFALSSCAPMMWTGLTWRPDVVFAIAPSLIAAPIALLTATVSGAESWLHVQDFEVEAAFATGLLDRDNRIAANARAFEKWVLSQFGVVSTISPQMCKRLNQKGVAGERIVEFRNWADIDAIYPMGERSPYRDEWGITTPHVALYSGNIANKQGIEIVIDAARRLKDRHDLTFVVCGEGPNRANLEKRAEGLTNIQFHDLQPTERLNELLGLATIHLLPQKAETADLVLPSKLTNMLASGRPIVATAAPETGLAAEVEGCGIITPPEDADAFAAGIELLASGGSVYDDLGQRARLRAIKRWSRKEILTEVSSYLADQSFARRAGQKRLHNSPKGP